MSKQRNSEPMWRRYLRFHGPDPLADLDDELRDHLASTEEKLVASGMSPLEAREEALRRFGDVDRVRREVGSFDMQQFRRAQWRERLGSVWQDVRYGARMLQRSPGFALVATSSIAIAIAANSTVFSVVNAMLLQAIPGAHADGVVRVYVNRHSPLSWHDLDWFRQHAQSFVSIAGERRQPMSLQLSGTAEAQRVSASIVTQGYFETMRVPMALGTSFDVEESRVGDAAPVAVLNHRFWQQHFGGDSSVVGRVLNVAGQPTTVVGVANEEFNSSVVFWSADIYVPAGSALLLTNRRLENQGSFYTVARLRNGGSIGDASAELGVLRERLASIDSARYERVTFRVGDARGMPAEGRNVVSVVALFLMAMVALVLLVACANVANLLLGRATARQPEIGIRLALGATRFRLVRQLLTESLLLAVLAGLTGFGITALVTSSIAALLPAEAGVDPGFFAPDIRVVLFTAVTCLVTTLLFGLVPALRASSTLVVPMLKSVAGTTRKRRRVLIGVQAGLSVVLLVAASLFIRSMQQMSGVDPGFDARGVVNTGIDLSLAGYDESNQLPVFDRIVQQARELAGVEHATLSAVVPLTGSTMETSIAPEGMSGSSRFDFPTTAFNVIGTEYFETMRMSIERGRQFEQTDVTGMPVAIVNQTAARRWWPDEDPLGKRFRWGGPEGTEFTVVGVAADIDYNMPGESPRTFVYLPVGQQVRSELVLQTRSTVPAHQLRTAVWEVLRSEVPSLPPPAVQPMSDETAVVMLPIRAAATFLGTLGLVALLLSATGIYGVTAYAVARRTRELGIRAALGATRMRLLGLVVSDSMRPVAYGIASGLLLSFGLAWGLSRALYGVQTFDPIALPSVLLLLGGVALIAAFVPAWRAARVDPVAAMRVE